MPTALPMMPASASGVSNTRSGPNSSYSPEVARKTPPNLPTSSPRTTTRLSRRISLRNASLTAWMMFIVGIGFFLVVVVRALGARLPQQPLLLLAQVPGRLLVDVVEERLDGRRRQTLRLVVRRDDLALQL